MPAPTFIATYSSAYNTGVTPKTTSVTTQAGDVVVVVAASENGTDNFNTISGNSISFTQQELFDAGTGDASIAIWTGTDTTGGTGWTLSVSRTSSTQMFGITCYVFRNSDGIGSAEVAALSAAAPSLAISTTQANSAIVVINCDWDADDGSSRTWRTVNGVTPTAGNNLERLYFRDAAAYTTYNAYYDDAGAVGSKTVGLSVPSSQRYAIAAVEVKGTPSTLLVTNNAEGGSNGTTVTTGNSGGASGDAWNTVLTDSQTLEYSATQSAHGGLSYHISLAAAGGPYVLWDSGKITTSGKSMYARIYLYFAADPPTINRFAQFTNSSIALIAGIGISSSNQFTIKDSAGTTIGTSTTTLPLNSWFRVEFYVFSSVTVGQVELKIFTTPDSSTATETITTTATQNTRGDDILAAVFGLPTAVASADFYMDDIGIKNTGYLGPAGSPNTPMPLMWITM